MVTQAPRASAVAVAVAFALSCVGLIVFVWSQFGGTIPFAAQGYRIHAEFRETGLLVPGADVRISGITVGRVTSVEARGVNSYVTMDVRRQYAPLPRDTHAVLRQKTLLGEAYVQLSPGTRSGPAFADGGTIPSRNIADTQALDQVLASFDRPTQRALQNLLAGFYSSIAGRGSDISGALGNLDPATQELTAVAHVLDAQGRDVQRLIRDGGSVLTTLGARGTDLQGLVGSGEAVLGTTARRDAALRATVAALPPFLTQLQSTLRGLDGTVTVAGPTLRALRPVAPLLAPALRDVIRLAGPAVHLLRRAPAVLRAGDRALPAIARYATAFDPAARALLGAAREVAPVVSFTGLYAKDITSAMENLAAVLEATDTAGVSSSLLAGAGRAHYLRFITPLGAESPGGQSRRPPSNRHNVDTAPGELADLAQGLRASDCANTANSPEVPTVVGATNVPCRTQPPFPFGAGAGGTHYFPHLMRAPR